MSLGWRGKSQGPSGWPQRCARPRIGRTKGVPDTLRRGCRPARQGRSVQRQHARKPRSRQIVAGNSLGLGSVRDSPRFHGLASTINKPFFSEASSFPLESRSSVAHCVQFMTRRSWVRLAFAHSFLQFWWSRRSRAYRSCTFCHSCTASRERFLCRTVSSQLCAALIN